MSENHNRLLGTQDGRTTFDHLVLVQPLSLLLRDEQDQWLKRGVVGETYPHLGSEGQVPYQRNEAQCSLSLTQAQVDVLKTFLTSSQRTSDIIAAQYGKVLLVRTFYDNGSDAAFARILSTYSEVSFAAVCDDKVRYKLSGLPDILRCLPVLVESTKFIHCNLMSKERQDKIVNLGQNNNCQSKNEALIDRLLLMDHTHPAYEMVGTLSQADLKRWSSIVGVVCQADQKTMECGLVKLHAFDRQGERIWCTRISSEELHGFIAGLGEGKSVFELRYALRQSKTGNGRRSSRSELAGPVESPPCPTYHITRSTVKKDQAEHRRRDPDSEDDQLVKVLRASNRETAAGEVKTNIQDSGDNTKDKTVGNDSRSKDSMRPDYIEQAELSKSRSAQQSATVELDKVLTREKAALAEASQAEQAIFEACVFAQRSNDARETAETDLRAIEQRNAELAQKLERVRTDYSKQLVDCAAARSWALEQRDAAVTLQQCLAEDLALERVKIANMEKALEATACAVASVEHNEKRTTQRSWQGIVDEANADDAEHVLVTRLSQVLAEKGQEISDLKEQLVKTRSAGINISDKSDQLTKQLADKVFANRELMLKIDELQSELQTVRRDLLTIREAAKENGELHIRFRKEMSVELTDSKQTIEDLEEENKRLHEQAEREAEGANDLWRRFDTTEKELGVAKQARMQAEQDLQSRSTCFLKDLEQTTKAKEEVLRAMVSIKETLERTQSERAALELRWKLECGKMRSEFAQSIQERQKREEVIEQERDRLSALLQKALVERDQATEDSTKSKDHLGAMYQAQLEARAHAEGRCQELQSKAVESAEALAKREKEMGERESLLVQRLQSVDLGFRDELVKRERAEEELEMWKWQNGVIALE